jgi:hypothetical protein
MRFVLDIDKEKTIDYLETKLRRLISFLYSWITHDGEILGYILGVLHFMISIVILILLFISHTLYPALWLQGFALFCMALIWFQHVILKVCISIVAEEKLTNGRAPFFGIVNDISNVFRIPLDRFIENLLVAETISVACFTLAFIGRISSFIQEGYLRGAWHQT